jgi:IclR family KDG regulon transcriptional repressor
MADHIQVVSRALHILEAVACQESPISLTAVVEKTNLPKTTVHRLLKALSAEGFIKSNGAGTYAIGKSLICLGAKVTRGGIVFNAAALMTKLRDITGCTVYLSSINDIELVYLHRVPGTIAPTSDAGYSGDIFCSTGGRAILSTYSDEHIEKIISQKTLQARTIYSIRTKKEFLKEIYATRQRGYSRSNNEYTIGVDGIGTPIFDYAGEAIAALSLVAVAGTISVSVEEYSELLLDTARDISEMLGHSTPITSKRKKG